MPGPTGERQRVLASLRNAAVYLLRRTGHPSVAAAAREVTARPELAHAMLHAQDPNSA